MRFPDRSPVLDKNRAPMGPETLSSTGAGAWRKAPTAFPDSSSVLDKFQSANIAFVSGLQKGPAERGHVKKRQKSSKSVKNIFDTFRRFSRRAKNVKNRQKVSKSFSTLFDNFRAAPFFRPLLQSADFEQNRIFERGHRPRDPGHAVPKPTAGKGCSSEGGRANGPEGPPSHANECRIIQDTFDHDKVQKSAISGRRLHWRLSTGFFAFSPVFKCNLARRAP